MIYCVWYPSGGFGHFVNAILTLHGDNFVRPKNNLEFSPVGDSHQLDLVAPKYFKNQYVKFDFLDEKNYCVLVDNGINDEGEQFKQFFPTATTIKICYSDRTWPIVARTLIDKAMRSNIDQELTLDNWDSNEDWARREKYFLFLRDHALRYAWKSTTTTMLFVDDLLDYNCLFDKLNSVVKIEPFEQLWLSWYSANSKYIEPCKIAQNIISQIKLNQTCDISAIKDIWTQAVVYYYVWIEFGVEVPHNDFCNFFTNTDQIARLVI